MKTTCYLVLLALIATAIAIKPHDHSFGEKVKEKGESMMEGVKASTNDAADTLNQAKYKVKHAMNGAKDTKECKSAISPCSSRSGMKEGIKEGYETVKEGLENAKEVLNVNQVVEDTKEAAKAKLADVTPITQNMTTIAIEAKNAIKKGVRPCLFTLLTNESLLANILKT